ncbi:hypothetical protein MMYC01_205891 [Madurella mycetomatis]|uniref:PD-(D/E)XK nuclease-like domain-containing protein n=1 Tax=Madurella mycetomatis TaxID=100816 RepID=A0A175W623_9PEZI|nr:hypothetical protein MMYC01_205891 [Madurella mycetomatis]
MTSSSIRSARKDGDHFENDKGGEDLERTSASDSQQQLIPRVRYPLRLAEAPILLPRPGRCEDLPAQINNPCSTFSSDTGTGASSKKRRGASPVKTTTMLRGLSTPFLYANIAVDDPRSRLPEDIHRLFLEVGRITSRESFIPSSVRKQVSELVDEDRVRTWWFFDDQSPDDALAELLQLRRIQADAQRCRRLVLSEAAWNLDVHGPLLRLGAVRTDGRVEREIITSARIAPQFLPTIDGKERTNVEGKMVDFALVLNLGYDALAELDVNRFQGKEVDKAGMDEATAEVIRRAVRAQPLGQQTINQTLYTGLQYRPAPVNVETKVSGIPEEGRVQLGIWTAAWRIRMLTFLDLQNQQRSLITLPLILVVEHQWYLLFACDRGDHMQILGDIRIGDTSTLLGLYSILAVIREVAKWLDEDFRHWFLDAFSGVAGDA